MYFLKKTERGMNIKSNIPGLTRENKSASGKSQWTGLEENGKHQDKHITAY